jgi:porphobilinogen synthase
MPGIAQLSPDLVLQEAKEIYSSGIPAVILFGIPKNKDESASGALGPDGIIQRTTKMIKDGLPGLVVITDLCTCEYMSHGHCGYVKDGEVLNDKTLDLLAEIAISQAGAGADIVAPSGMIDGMVGAIRECLDEEGFEDIAIMSYAAKYASAFYGPFRDAAESAPKMGDRKGYQMDPANSREALREVMLDVEEGADIIMIKPALPYLDIISKVSEEFDLPVAAYSVSGEYSMIEAAAKNGWIDRKKVILETLTSIKRAGADIVISYHAKEAAKML